MKLLLALITVGSLLAVAGCPKPNPSPVTPVPTDPTCGLAAAAHDTLVDAVVTDLQSGDAALEAEVAQYTTSTVGCIVDEILGDVHNADDVLAKAHAWRSVNPAMGTTNKRVYETAGSAGAGCYGVGFTPQENKQ